MKHLLIFLLISILSLSGCISNSPAAGRQDNKTQLNVDGNANLTDNSFDEETKENRAEKANEISPDKTANNSLLEKQKENELLRDRLNAEIADYVKKRDANITTTTTFPKISVTSTTEPRMVNNLLDGQVADKVEVFHFHGNSQCYSCKTIGAYSEETVNTYFSKELKSGRLVYAHINYDLPENKALARKYGAASSSLWIGVYKNNTFSKEEDINVWYKIDDKKGFMDYLRKTLETKLTGR